MDTQKIAGFAWPSMLILLTGIYAYWAAQRELVSSRPSVPGQHDVPDPVPDPGVHTLHTRMWEDPLSAACADWKRLREIQGAAKVHTFADANLSKKQVHAVASNVMGLHAGVIRLCTQFVPAFFDHRNFTNDRIDPLVQDYFADLATAPINCLPVFLPGGPYAEDKEKRMRIRYAVATALAESGYRLKYNRRMSYVVPKIYVRVMRGWQEREIVVPVKLYRGPGGWLLVLWINEPELGLRPMLATHRILNAIFAKVKKEADKPGNVRVSIIGPASSGTLEWIVAEMSPGDPKNWSERVDHWHIASYQPLRREEGYQPLLPVLLGDPNENRLNIFSPRATASDIDDRRMRNSVKLFRVTGTDLQLAEKIRSELELRGAWPGKVAFVTEHDTKYGQALPETFENVLLRNFTVHVEPLLQEKCIACHGAENQDAELRLDTYESVTALVKPGEPGKGKLFKKIKIDNESQDPHRVEALLYLKLGQWVELGAFPYSVLSGMSPLTGPVDSSFYGDIRPALDKHCGVCHGNDARSRMANLRLDNYESVIALVKPGKPKESELIQKLTSKDPHAVAALQYELLARWVKDGAPKNKDGYFASFRILRGIDGRLPGDKAERGDSRSLQLAAGNGSGDATEVTERPPEGRSQYDYLKRLHLQVKQFGDVTAIGVVGSDVYDKLLVIRALKPDFPDAVFFTTDLHAIFTHPNERRHTRNLVIASHFGLTLDRRLQKNTAPFRDSYQTATFLATRLAIHEYLAHAPHTKDDYEKAGTLEDIVGRLNDKDTKRRNKGGKEAGLEPLVYVVGRDRIQQLNDFNEHVAKERVSALVHPSPNPESGGGHLLFVVAMAVLSTGGALAWLNCDWLHKLVLLKGEEETVADEHMQRLRVWRSGLLVCFGFLFAAGIAVQVILAFNGQFANISLSGAYNTAARNVLYAFIGMAAVLSLAYLVGRFVFTLHEETAVENAKTYELAWNTLSVTHILKGACLALVVVYAGTLFVSGFSWYSTGATEIIIGLLVVASVLVARYCHKRGIGRDTAPLISKNLILSGSPVQAAKWTVGSMLVVTLIGLLASWAGEPRTGWNFVSTSRGEAARESDWLAVTYAFGMVGALISSLVFTHFWCREFSCYAKRLARQWDNREAAALDRLRLMGKLTAVPSSLAPVLMAILLVLVLAYHPMLSPTPMPIGLLVVATMVLILLVASAVSLRLHFGRERSEALDGLQDQNAEQQESVAKLQAECNQLEVELEALRVRLATFSDRPSRHGRPATDPNETASGAATATAVQPAETRDGSEPHADRGPTEEQSQSLIDQKEYLHHQKRMQLLDAREAKELLQTRKKQVESISNGVFKPLSQTAYGWILGGGTTLALVELWVRWWLTGN